MDALVAVYGISLPAAVADSTRRPATRPATILRRCPRCEQDLPLSAFGKRRKRGKIYPLPYCKTCHVAYHRQWRQTPSGREKFGRKLRETRARYPERQAARRAVQVALRSGRLVKGPCELARRGNCSGGIEAHHDDYSKPLEVRWTCRRHHRTLDRQRRTRVHAA